MINSYINNFPEVMFILSLILLSISADKVVEYSDGLGKSLNIPDFILGSTILAFGTSLPELITSLQAINVDKTLFPIDNVVGSNITNISLIGGMILIFSSAKVKLDKIDIVLLVLVSVAFSGMIFNEKISSYVIGMLLIVYLLRIFLSEKEEEGENQDKDSNNNIITVILIVISLTILFLSADLLIDTVTKLSSKYNLSESSVTLIMVALGTSLPELVLSIIALIKNKVNMAIGNVVGSNILNILIVVGIANTVESLDISGISEAINAPLLGVTALFLSIFLLSAVKLQRIVGALLIIIYGIYIYYALSY